MSIYTCFKSGYRIVQRAIILIVLFGLSSTPYAEKTKTIVIIGDSLSAAHNIDPSTAWPQLLQKKIDAKKLGYKIVNTSISGDTSYTALSRHKKTLSKFKPEICFIAIGSNDGLQGLSLKQLENNLAELVKLCKQYTNKILLFEMKLPLNYGKAFTDRFIQIFHRVAKNEQVSLLPFFMEPFALDMNLFLPDRIHPSEQAQPVMTDIVWKGFIRLIKS